MINHTRLYAHMDSLNTECFWQLTAGRGIKVSSKYGIIMEATSGMQKHCLLQKLFSNIKKLKWLINIHYLLGTQTKCNLSILYRCSAVNISYKTGPAHSLKSVTLKCAKLVTKCYRSKLVVKTDSRVNAVMFALV